MVEYCDLAYNSYKSHAEDIINTKFKNVFPDWTVDFPLKGPHSLGGEVYVLHQLGLLGEIMFLNQLKKLIFNVNH